jgi:far upstream element-binding protein
MATGGAAYEFIEIPAPMVGKLIGKGGETIKQLQFSTGTKVQIDHQTPGDMKKVSIQGNSAEAVEAAKKQVEQIVSTDEGGAGGVQESVECPQGIVGRIIGRGGETIRSLQQASQAHIVVDQNFPEGQPRRVNISGRPEAVERAVKMVSELISGEPGSAQSIIQKVFPLSLPLSRSL